MARKTKQKQTSVFRILPRPGVTGWVVRVAGRKFPDGVPLKSPEPGCHGPKVLPPGLLPLGG